MRIKSTYEMDKAQKFDLSQWYDSPIFLVIGELLELGYAINLESYFLRFPGNEDLDKWVKIIHYHGTPNDKRFKEIPQYPKSYLLDFDLE